MEMMTEREREGEGEVAVGLCNISRMVVGTYQGAEPSITPICVKSPADSNVAKYLYCHIHAGVQRKRAIH